MKRLGYLLLSALLCAAPVCGCAVSEAKEQPTRLVAFAESQVPAVPPISATPGAVITEASASPTPSATPVELPEGAIPQLYLNGNFMPPKSLDGIDPLSDKVVALTFDDGPHKTNTDRLLQILAQNGAVATFFMVGENVAKYPEIVKRVYDAGNEIGTHTYTHANLKGITIDQIMNEQIGKTNDLIEEITGARTIIDRPPYGSITEGIASAMGREQIMWNIDPEDWKKEYKSTAALMDNIFNGTNTGVKVRDGSIILSHDIHSTTIDAYDSIIKELKAQGYKFVTVTQLMQIAKIRGKELSYIFNGAPSIESMQNNGAAQTQPTAEAINQE